MEGIDVKDNSGQYSSEPLSYVMSAILFGQMHKQTNIVWKSGVGLEGSFLKRKLMSSTLVVVERNRLDRLID